MRNEKLLFTPILILRDKWGFGATRLERFIDHYWEVYDSIDKGFLNLDDIARVMKEELGIVVEIERDEA